MAPAEHPPVPGPSRSESGPDGDTGAGTTHVREQVSLADGTTILVRSVDPDDPARAELAIDRGREERGRPWCG